MTCRGAETEECKSRLLLRGITKITGEFQHLIA